MYLARYKFLDFIKKHWPALLAFGLVARFAFKVAETGLAFPNLLRVDQIGGLAGPAVVFFVSFAVIVCLIFIIRARVKHQRSTNNTDARNFFNDHIQPIALAAIFFVVYYVLASVFNRLDFNNNNVFFAADTNSWRLRLATESGYLMGMRAIHPLAFLILRPLVWLVSVLAGTDLFHGTLLLLALTGASGIFLAWRVIKGITEETNHATLFTAVLGISTASLIFNSLIETYIFSGFLLILFFFLLSRQKSFFWLVPVGVATFGITISNIVQSLIALHLADLKLRRALVFLVLVLVFSTGLSFVNNAIYPNSNTFLDTEESSGEFGNYLASAQEAGFLWRGGLIGSDMFGYSVVAPKPFLQIYNRDDNSGQFPKFNFMQGERLSQFVGTGKITIWIWLGILVAAVILFARSLWQERLSAPNRFGLAALGCLAFNFLFHAIYGFEPFLYAADWIYALIFFAAIGTKSLSKNFVLQATLVILLAMLTLNNLSFIFILMNGISPFVPAI